MQDKATTTTLPYHIKNGLEYFSGYDMSDVSVHYHSEKPAFVEAVAYAEGDDIYIASGYEQHLAHEAWHVVQQKQGRVTPTLSVKEYSINNDACLENEAVIMAHLLQHFSITQPQEALEYRTASSGVIQRMTFEEASRITQENYAIGWVEHESHRPEELYLLMPTDNLEEIVYGDRPDLLSTDSFYHRLHNTCRHLLLKDQQPGNLLIAKPFAYEAKLRDGALLKCCELFSDYRMIELIDLKGHTVDELFESLKTLLPHLNSLSSDQRWESCDGDELDGFLDGWI